MLLIGIEGSIDEALRDAREEQNVNRSREMACVITKLEEADMWLRKLQIQTGKAERCDGKPYGS